MFCAIRLEARLSFFLDAPLRLFGWLRFIVADDAGHDSTERRKRGLSFGTER